MPHLSPLNWLLMLMFSLTIMLMLNSMSWWHYSMKAPMVNLKKSLLTKPWLW